MGASIASSDSTRSEGGGVIMKNTQQARPQSEAFWEDDDAADDEDDALADGEDVMYEQAVDMVRRLNKASVSLLQRRLRIGYGRAAHLIDLMERDGIVGAADGPKPREVLKRPDWISEVEESMR
jgi:S-DNA-T family DNA segregation ATPase FtsK/SpoIIIE